MTREQLLALAGRLYEEGIKRENLGGYSADSETLLFLTSVMYRFVNHLIDKEKKPTKPRKRKKKR